MLCLEKLKNDMKNLKSVQLDFIPVISQMWIGAWTVLLDCINFIDYLMLIDVKGLERKHFWPLKLLSLQLPRGAD
jgi:ABC-type phosphate transport system auxiliary subunit